jgi:hypothetical protein
LPIVIDSGASVSFTPHIRDFRGPLQKCPTKSLDGLSKKTEVLGMVKVTWEVQDFLRRKKDHHYDGLLRTDGQYKAFLYESLF